MKIPREHVNAIREALSKLIDERAELADSLDKYNSEVSSAYGALSDAFDKYTNEIERAWADHVSGAIDGYNEVAGELASAIESAASEMRDAWNEKSEKWQGGEAGQDADATISELESFEVPEFSPDEPEGLSLPDEPDELEPPDEIDDPTGGE